MMAYLGENDSLQDLQKLLRFWCTASGARFNIPKMVVIPVGTKSYWEEVICTHKQGCKNQVIPRNIEIAKEGEATCLLEVFIGNKVKNTSVWTPTIEVVTRDLNRWGKGRPTMEGRRLIINMAVGEHTQYRARVQGMPKHVEEQLTRMVREFMWANSLLLPIGLGTLHLLIKEEGQKVLDIDTLASKLRTNKKCLEQNKRMFSTSDG
ncbi:hypothetical protein J132_03369 [Termitomyces sp. J132]|nr:hypothetical protein J132_03369 [Termitomyces sp. J132]